MKICAIQNRPLPGDLPGNIKKHLDWIEISAGRKADLVLFPELSLTGYEPKMARRLAINSNDSRLEPFQVFSEKHHLNIAVGAPLRANDEVQIGLIVFSPLAPRRCYTKGFLHPDEKPFFSAREDQPVMAFGTHRVALSICYEVSVPDHLKKVMEQVPHAYAASVAKFSKGIDAAFETLSSIARDYSMPVIMANSIGPSDGGFCAGNTTAWNAQGEILARLGEFEENGILLDLDSSKATKIVF